MLFTSPLERRLNELEFTGAAEDAREEREEREEAVERLSLSRSRSLMKLYLVVGPYFTRRGRIIGAFIRRASRSLRLWFNT